MTAPENRPRDALGRPLARDEQGIDHGINVDAVRSATDALDTAQDLLDRGFPFAAHEVLEARWKAGPPDERDWWQGLAQTCVALTHAMRGNHVGSDQLLRRARLTLQEGDSHAGASGSFATSAIMMWIDDALACLHNGTDLPRLVVNRTVDTA